MTSVVLIILALSMRAVSSVDSLMRRRATDRQAQEQPTSDAPVILELEPIEDRSDDRAKAAAIAVALTLSLRKREQAQIEPIRRDMAPVTSNAVHDTWLTEGRARQHANRGANSRAKYWDE